MITRPNWIKPEGRECGYLYCECCGSRRVQVSCWVHANTDAIIGEGIDGADGTWCDDCETHPGLTADRREAAAARLAFRREREGRAAS